jgi:hypothetical protein
MDDPRQHEENEQSDAPETPPETSEPPSHEEQIGGEGAEDPAEMADEDRYRKGPGW